MGDAIKLGKQPIDTLIGQGKGVSPGNNYIPDYGSLADILDRLSPMGFESLGMATDQSRPRAIATIDRAETCGEKQDPIRIAVHDTGNRAGILLMKGILALSRAYIGFFNGWYNGFPQSTVLVFQINQTQIIGGDGKWKPIAGFFKSLAFLKGWIKILGNVFQGGDPVG
jgi:hypothetical protein